MKTANERRYDRGKQIGKADRESRATIVNSARWQDERVLVCARDEAESEILSKILFDRGLEVTICGDISELCTELESGAGLAVIDADRLNRHARSQLTQTLELQPKWSDFPFILMTEPEKDHGLGGMILAPLENTLLLERPVSARSFWSAGRVALRSRRQ